MKNRNSGLKKKKNVQSGNTKRPEYVSMKNLQSIIDHFFFFSKLCGIADRRDWMRAGREL